MQLFFSFFPSVFGYGQANALTPLSSKQLILNLSKSSPCSITRAVSFVLSILLISTAQTTCRPIGRTLLMPTHPQGRTGHPPLTPPPRATLSPITSIPSPHPALALWRRVQNHSPLAHPHRQSAGLASLPQPRPLPPLLRPPLRHLTSIRTPSPAVCTSPSTAHLATYRMPHRQTLTLHHSTSNLPWYCPAMTSPLAIPLASLRPLPRPRRGLPVHVPEREDPPG